MGKRIKRENRSIGYNPYLIQTDLNSLGGYVCVRWKIGNSSGSAGRIDGCAIDNSTNNNSQ